MYTVKLPFKKKSQRQTDRDRTEIERQRARARKHETPVITVQDEMFSSEIHGCLKVTVDI